MPPQASSRRGRGGALAVGAGIFLSRIAGFVRERALAHYLGNSEAAGAFRAAMRIPNILQNLLGEGVLSASFIPVYSKLLAQGQLEEARRAARAVGTLLALMAALVTALGVSAAAPLVDLLAPGFEGETRELTVTLVRVLFPGVALLVLSAWCLGVLNSHRKFFLSYVSPVLWNAAIVAAAIAFGRRLGGERSFDLAVALAWGAVAGSALQLAVQLPSVLRLLGSLRPSLAVGDPAVRTTLRTFVPVLLGRGSVQISAYLDQLLASYLGPSIVAAIGYAQTLALLPVSLFGMAVSAAALPELSATMATAATSATSAAAGATSPASTAGSGPAGAHQAPALPAEVAAALRDKLRASLRQVVFLVVPSAVAFVAIGDTMIALLFESGRFGAQDTQSVWILLAGSALGLTASTQGRLLASSFYAIGDPRPPLRASLWRVTFTFVAGLVTVFPLRQALGYDARWAAFGLAAASSLAAWVELTLLRRALARRIESVPLPTRLTLGALAAAGAAGALAAAASWAAAGPLGLPRMLAMAVAPPLFGATYLGLTMLARVPEAASLRRRLLRR
ncbi:MAG: murein biosynthesis integral membrane protein MurJ [Myxococcales bacterium]|nr:murein biosynthesis integral membrane protein MurJ [Myxococcales bacterium]